MTEVMYKGKTGCHPDSEEETHSQQKDVFKGNRLSDSQKMAHSQQKWCTKEKQTVTHFRKRTTHPKQVKFKIEWPTFTKRWQSQQKRCIKGKQTLTHTENRRTKSPGRPPDKRWTPAWGSLIPLLAQVSSQFVNKKTKQKLKARTLTLKVCTSAT